MACEPKTYGGVDATKMQQIRQELRKLGLTVPDTEQGKITSAEIGVEAEFRWDSAAQTVSVEIFQKPFFLPCGFIYGRLEQTINRSPGT